ncbi:MAG: hypothetical protein FE048_00110 [Thermoplasmata archaeon]|nr:MAG: hypothetical protein FE048_00110 [Thermoplasmata archaeon]
MKKIALLIILLLFLPYAGQSSDEIKGGKITDFLPPSENISLFLLSLPYEIERREPKPINLTLELGVQTGKVEFLYEKKAPWLKDAFLEYYELNGINVDQSSLEKLFSEIDELPYELGEGLALLIYTINDVEILRRDAFHQLEKNDVQFLKEHNKSSSTLAELLRDIIMEKIGSLLLPNLNLFSDGSNELASIVKRIDMEKLVEGSISLFDTLQKVIPIFKKYDIPSKMLLEDPSGSIYFGGSLPTTYKGNYSIIVDIGGNDIYYANPMEKGVCLLLDIHGNDRYMGKKAHAFLGIDMVYDEEGNDVYMSSNFSQAYACAGVSILLDNNGDDVYTSKTYSQGSAYARGIAALIDISGNDVYASSNFSQAYSDGFGFSSLLDISGDDFYTAIAYSQGSATGGGISFLLDFLGNDKYVSKRNSQGAGEGWGEKKISIGSLIDLSGNDKYISKKEAQGFGKNLGLGTLLDFLGDDTYYATNASQACSKLFGLACLVDVMGKNVYESVSSSQQYEQMGGTAIFLSRMDDMSNEKLWWLIEYMKRNEILPTSFLE